MVETEERKIYQQRNRYKDAKYHPSQTNEVDFIFRKPIEVMRKLYENVQFQSKNDKRVDHHDPDQSEENSVVPLANAVVQPRAVVVEVMSASIAHSTVLAL